MSLIILTSEASICNDWHSMKRINYRVGIVLLGLKTVVVINISVYATCYTDDTFYLWFHYWFLCSMVKRWADTSYLCQEEDFRQVLRMGMGSNNSNGGTSNTPGASSKSSDALHTTSWIPFDNREYKGFCAEAAGDMITGQAFRFALFLFFLILKIDWNFRLCKR